MYIHELRDITRNVHITSMSLGSVHLLVGPSGAVFDRADFSDILNIALATGHLFQNDWRLSTPEEVEVFNSRDDKRVVKPMRVVPFSKGSPNLTVIDGGRSESEGVSHVPT